MTWQPGHDRIEELLAAGELEQVTPADSVASLLLEDAGRHLATAAAAVETGDLAGAYQLAYDALRKSAASLLAAQGLRATSRGGLVRWADGRSSDHLVRCLLRALIRLQVRLSGAPSSAAWPCSRGRPPPRR